MHERPSGGHPQGCNPARCQAVLLMWLERRRISSVIATRKAPHRKLGMKRRAPWRRMLFLGLLPMFAWVGPAAHAGLRTSPTTLASGDRHPPARVARRGSAAPGTLLHPKHGPTKPLLHESPPTPHGAWPNPFTAKPSPYGAWPNPFTVKPNPHGAWPNPFTVKPSPYGAWPNPFTVKPSPYGAWPNPFTVKPNPHAPWPNPFAEGNSTDPSHL
jgi:hypothetical protein